MESAYKEDILVNIGNGVRSIIGLTGAVSLTYGALPEISGEYSNSLIFGGLAAIVGVAAQLAYSEYRAIN